MRLPRHSSRYLHALFTAMSLLAGGLIFLQADPAKAVTSLDTLYTFYGTGNGGIPHGGLIVDSDGFFYGTTTTGGPSGHQGGTVFRLATDGTLLTLSSFLAGAPDAAPTLGFDGSLYGTSPFGGQSGNGFVYHLSTAGNLQVVGSFSSTATGGTPYAGLLRGSDGNFYGTTTQGAKTAPNGAILRIAPGGTETTLHFFAADGSEGTLSYGTLVEGRDGDFYGTTSLGGSARGGTIFKVDSLGFFTTLHVFTGGADGEEPHAGLTLGSDGNFYGTTMAGGSGGAGTIFRLTPQGTFTTLHSFTPGADEGASPASPLLDGKDGFFYGTTVYGGADNAGTVYTVSPAGSLATVYSFTGGKDGAQPYGALALGGSGVFYGTTSAGGLNNGSNGTAFRLDLHAVAAVPGVVGFSTVITDVSESAGTATLLVSRTGGSTGAVSVGYTTADGTAKANVDYFAVTGTVGWEPGDTAPKSFTVPISNLGIADNSSRVFSVRLFTPTGGAALGANTTETVNIREDDDARPTSVNLSLIGDGTAVVGGEKGRVLFSRSGDTSAPLVVQYQLKGKPINGVDYEYLPGSLTIPAGEAGAKLKIKPIPGTSYRGTSNLRIIPVAPTDGSYSVDPAQVKIRFISTH